MNRFVRNILIVLLLVSTVLLGVKVHQAFSAEPEPTYTVPDCQTLFDPATRVYLGTKQLPNGLTIVGYAIEGNRQLAIALVTGDENRYPLFYMLGTQTTHLITHVDQYRDGTCVGLKIYWQAHLPKQGVG